MATFRYTLRTPDAVVQFGTDQVRNWQDVKPSIVKNRTYRGVFQTMTSTIEFVDQIRDLIIRTVDNHGYDVGIFLTIEIGNDNRERSSFRTFEGLSDMKAEISEIDITELAVSLNFIESGFVSDILNREAVKVNLDVTETIDGETILPPYEDLLQDLHLHDRRLIYESKFEKQGDHFLVLQTTGLGDGGGGIGIPANIVYRSGDNMQSIFPAIGSLKVTERGVYSFLYDSDYSGDINVKGKVKGEFYFPPPGSTDLEEGWGLTGSFRWQLDLFVGYKGVRDGKTGRTIKTLATGSDITVNNSRAIFDANFDEDFNIQEGDSVGIIFFILTNVGSPVSFEAHITTDEVEFESSFLGEFPATIAKSLKPHELFERLIHIITGEKNAFYSDYFGREDLGYEKDGEGAYLSVLNGLMIRGFPDDETHLNTSFKEAFEAFSKEKNLVGTVQTINNKKVFRIEKYEDIYIQKVSLKLGAVLDVSRSIDYERIFSEIKTGGKDEEYEEVNGLYSFNGEFNFATPLQTSASILNLISPYRKDDIGIELTRRLQYESDPTKDYRADKDIFIIDAYLSNGMLYARRAEQYSVVNGIYEAQYVYNLSLSPVRQLMLWGNVISSGLLQKIDKSLKFTKGAKNQDLESQKIGGSLIVESDDIPILELAKPIILPDDILIAEAKMTFDEYRTISEKTTHLIEFENKEVTIFGYISNAEFDFEKNLCNFEIERANY